MEFYRGWTPPFSATFFRFFSSKLRSKGYRNLAMHFPSLPEVRIRSIRLAMTSHSGFVKFQFRRRKRNCNTRITGKFHRCETRFTVRLTSECKYRRTECIMLEVSAWCVKTCHPTRSSGCGLNSRAVLHGRNECNRCDPLCEISGISDGLRPRFFGVSFPCRNRLSNSRHGQARSWKEGKDIQGIMPERKPDASQSYKAKTRPPHTNSSFAHLTFEFY